MTRRLRWQLTLSHLAAIAVTLVSMVAAVILIAGGWVRTQMDPRTEEAREARAIASAVGGLVARGGGGYDEMDAVLRGLASGDLRLSSQDGPPWTRAAGSSGLEYVLIVGPDQRILASSDPAGSAFSPPGAAWQTLALTALGGERDPARLVRLVGAGSGEPASAHIRSCRRAPAQSPSVQSSSPGGRCHLPATAHPASSHRLRFLAPLPL
jgi:hypothetical protein